MLTVFVASSRSWRSGIMLFQGAEQVREGVAQSCPCSQGALAVLGGFLRILEYMYIIRTPRAQSF